MNQVCLFHCLVKCDQYLRIRVKNAKHTYVINTLKLDYELTAEGHLNMLPIEICYLAAAIPHTHKKQEN